MLSDVPIIMSLLGLILSSCSRTDFTCTSSWKIARRTAFKRLDSFLAEKPATILLSWIKMPSSMMHSILFS